MTRARALAALVAFLLIATLAPTSRAAAPSAAYTASGFAAPHGLAVALGDFRGDGTLQMVVQTDDGTVKVLEGSTGKVLASFAPGNAGCTSACYSFEGVPGPINAPVVADVDHSGKLSIIVADTAAVVARYQFDPARSSHDSFAFNKIWERRFGDFGAWTMDAAPVVADLDGDGNLDTLVVTEENGIFAARPDGSILWAQNRPGGHATPGVRDLDLDGKPEAVIARDDGIVDVLNGATGAVKWSVDLAAQGITPGSVPAAPLLSDVTGDGRPDVVVTARDAHDASNFANDHFAMFAIDSFGHILWRFQPSWGAPMSHTRSVLASINGAKAIVGVDWNTIGHKPGSFERVGPGHVFAVSTAGKELWHADLNAQAQSKMDIVIADALGTGGQQVLVEGTRNGVEGILAFDLNSGAYLGMLPTGAWSVTAGAAAGNLFGDGRFALAVPVAQGGSGGVTVFHGGNALNAMFPGWAAISPPRGSPGALGGTGGTGGTTGGTTTPPPTSGGTTGATFGPKGNEWWVETSVKAGEAITGVTVTLNGGPSVALPATSWGTYAKSIHAVSGTVLQFQARGASGATYTSGCYQWTTAAPATCPSGTPPPPPPTGSTSTGTFTATFTPSKNGNDWWVETSVASSSTITGVDAKVGTSAWTPLTKQSWGSWAKSIHAPAGSQVTFQAHDAAGSTATSATYTWPVR